MKHKTNLHILKLLKVGQYNIEDVIRNDNSIKITLTPLPGDLCSRVAASKFNFVKGLFP